MITRRGLKRKASNARDLHDGHWKRLGNHSSDPGAVTRCWAWMSFFSASRASKRDGVLVRAVRHMTRGAEKTSVAGQRMGIIALGATSDRAPGLPKRLAHRGPASALRSIAHHADVLSASYFM